MNNQPLPAVNQPAVNDGTLPLTARPSRATLDLAWQSQVTVVTGTIGSGKSTVVDIMKELGACCVSADELARRAVAKGSEGLASIVREFGEGVLREDGVLDRKKLAEVVFNDKEKLARLEAITHPIIAALAESEFSAAIARGEPGLLVYECPLFFEKGMAAQSFGRVVLVTADEQTCLERVMKRDGVDESQARARLAKQLPVEEKRKGADIIIDNSFTLDHLRSQVTIHYRALLACLRAPAGDEHSS